MGNNLTGDDARIWELHAQGFPVSRICNLVGFGDGYVRALICSVWRDDKLTGSSAKKS